MELDKIYCEDCRDTMVRIGGMIDCVLTSPPYNTQGHHGSDISKHQQLYESYGDDMTEEEYCEWTCRLFDGFDNVLKPNGSVLYNISYSSKQPWTLWNLIADIQRNTVFTVSDCIIWKKRNALPNTESPNKLTRICEYVFVFCRKSELQTFNCYKEKGVGKNSGQQTYRNYFNFIEAPNNDENCPIHKATFSSVLVEKLLLLYTKRSDVVYDPFMGTGTTAIGCIKQNRHYIGSEISQRYVNWAQERIEKENSQLKFDFGF